MKVLGINTEWAISPSNTVFTDISLSNKHSFSSYDVIVINTHYLLHHSLRGEKFSILAEGTLDSRHKIRNEVRDIFTFSKKEIENFLKNGKNVYVFLGKDFNGTYKDTILFEDITLSDFLPVQLKIEQVIVEDFQPKPQTLYYNFLNKIKSELKVVNILLNEDNNFIALAEEGIGGKVVAEELNYERGRIIFLPSLDVSILNDESEEKWVAHSENIYNAVLQQEKLLSFSKNNKKNNNIHSNIISRLIDDIKAKGIPEKNIAIEWNLLKEGDRIFRIDVAILDDSLEVPLIIFEVKPKFNEQEYSNALKQLKSYAHRIKVPISCWLITPDEKFPYIKYYELTEQVYSNSEAFQNLTPSVFRTLDFTAKAQNLSADVKMAKNKERNEEEKNAVQRIITFSWIVFPIIVFLLVLLDRLCILLLTTERLIVYAVATVISLLPFVREIRYGDYSFSFIKDEEKDKNSKSKNNNEDT